MKEDTTLSPSQHKSLERLCRATVVGWHKDLRTPILRDFYGASFIVTRNGKTVYDYDRTEAR